MFKNYILCKDYKKFKWKLNMLGILNMLDIYVKRILENVGDVEGKVWDIVIWVYRVKFKNINIDEVDWCYGNKIFKIKV